MSYVETLKEELNKQLELRNIVNDFHNRVALATPDQAEEMIALSNEILDGILPQRHLDILGKQGYHTKELKTTLYSVRSTEVNILSMTHKLGTKIMGNLVYLITPLILAYQVNDTRYLPEDITDDMLKEYIIYALEQLEIEVTEDFVENMLFRFKNILSVGINFIESVKKEQETAFVFPVSYGVAPLSEYKNLDKEDEALILSILLHIEK